MIKIVHMGRADFKMSEQDYFKKALSNFTYDAASGGAIHHLADRGYTVKQIMERLSFPTPYERVQKTVWEHFVNTGVLLLEEPGSDKQREKVTYVRDYDKYGRTSFRCVKIPQDSAEMMIWQEHHLNNSNKDGLTDYFLTKCMQNGEEQSYVSCNFGLQSKEKSAKVLERLEEEQRDYILGLPWERKICYHRLDRRMREIICTLYEQGEYHGICYFSKKREKIVL